MKVGLEYDRVDVLLPGTSVAHKERLKQLLREKSLVKGEFTLSSGEKSDRYIDCKLTTLDPLGAVLTGHTVLEHLEEHGVKLDAIDAIGGPEIGAIPIVTAVATVSYLRAEREKTGKPLPAFFVRKARKEHGREKRIEGIDLSKIQNRKVVIVDEVCTKGISIEFALEEVAKQQIEVIAVVVLVDRQEGGHKKLKEKYGDRYMPIFTADELFQEDQIHHAATQGR